MATSWAKHWMCSQKLTFLMSTLTLFENEKRVSWLWKKNDLIASIYGLYFSLKMQFEECLGKKTFLFVCCRLNDNQNVFISSNCPCLKKIIVVSMISQYWFSWNTDFSSGSKIQGSNFYCILTPLSGFWSLVMR